MTTRNTLCLALKRATLHGQVEVAHLLLDAGADVSARDENGDSQAHFAVFECVLLLYCHSCTCRCTFSQATVAHVDAPSVRLQLHM